MTPAQITLIKAAIAADPVMSQAAMDPPGHQVVQNALNAIDPAFFVWKTTSDAAAINDAITWANLTPSDAADGTAIFTNRALVCQAKQINLQIFLQGRDTINSAKNNIRAGFQDSLTNIPSGAGGVLQNANWPAVKTAMTRNANVLEKVLATGTGTTGSPANLGFEGTISLAEVEAIRTAP